jgi:catechol 2,3-dioxygenase-like lactoylglutathione lyase family enzyme
MLEGRTPDLAQGTPMPVSIRYIVDGVDAAIAFYTEALGFRLDLHPAPGFAALSRDGLRLLVNRPGAGGAGQALGAAGSPAPGGWNRFQIETADLDAMVAGLTRRGCRFRSAIVQGNGGRQVLVEDPSGNPVELFEPAARPG